MLSKIFFAAAAMALVVSVLAGGSAGKGGKPAEPNTTCKGEPMNTTIFWVGFKECYQQVVPQSTPSTTDAAKANQEINKNWKENEMCIDVCIWKKQGFLNADGSYNKDGAEKFVKAAFPAKAQDAAKKAFNECAATHGKSLSTDKKCASYVPLKNCKVKKYLEICEIKH